MHAEFLFDLASPNAYLAHKVLPQIETRTGVRFDYVPVLLGGIFKATNNQAPMVAFANVRNKLAYEQLELQRFVNKHQIRYQMNPFFPLNSLQMMRVATGAWLDGGLRPYLDAAMDAMWAEPKKLDDPDVLRVVLHDAGLDAERLTARAQDRDVKDALIKNTETAVARGVFGIPSFFIDGELFYGKDRLRDVEDELTRQG
jgi:2-hydroxychromene-2-carboxylate isomerase